jgi:hypothetical protein
MECFLYKEFDEDQFSPNLPFRVNLEGKCSKWLVFEASGDIWLHGQTPEPQEMCPEEAIDLIQTDLDNWKDREEVTARIQRDLDNWWWGKGEPASWFL